MSVLEYHLANFAPVTARGRPLTESERLAELIALSEFRDRFGRFPTADEFRREYPHLVWPQ